jgi:glucose-6-phosphate isomerase
VERKAVRALDTLHRGVENLRASEAAGDQLMIRTHKSIIATARQNLDTHLRAVKSSRLAAEKAAKEQDIRSKAIGEFVAGGGVGGGNRPSQPAAVDQISAAALDEAIELLRHQVVLSEGIMDILVVVSPLAERMLCSC